MNDRAGVLIVYLPVSQAFFGFAWITAGSLPCWKAYFNWLQFSCRLVDAGWMGFTHLVAWCIKIQSNWAEFASYSPIPSRQLHILHQVTLDSIAIVLNELYKLGKSGGEVGLYWTQFAKDLVQKKSGSSVATQIFNKSLDKWCCKEKRWNKSSFF